ncbi:hydantoinase/oxoprolinase family protein [Chloroherpeton thalassium]|uniref:hydantoinase/oxoprolinase family protein n=1 Tax=Chloroherpeton thalassium TaxID=100716 RepID=UPI001B7FE259|nr:hydantoinase/oxoprolinase family protein [Chloroherpeton thalassium]
MERAIRVISVEKGFDPREFSLFSFGGAGGLHCATLARQLSLPRVIVPKNPGILSAFGMVMADVIKDYSQTVMLSGASLSFGTVQEKFASLERQAVDEMAREGFSGDALRLERFLDVRYQGQSFELIVPFAEDFEEKFSAQHEQTYGYRNSGKAIEVVNIRLRAYGSPEKPVLLPAEKMTDEIPHLANFQERVVHFDGREYRTKIFDREKLLPGNQISGPAILVEYSSTIVLPPFASGKIDALGNLIIEIKS